MWWDAKSIGRLCILTSLRPRNLKSETNTKSSHSNIAPLRDSIGKRKANLSALDLLMVQASWKKDLGATK